MPEDNIPNTTPSELQNLNIGEQQPVQQVPNSGESFIKKNFTPKFMGLIGLLIALGVATYSGVYYFQKQQTQTTIPTFTPRPSINSSTSSGQVPADWKTYRNEEYGFEVKYPGDWYADINKNPIFEISVSNVKTKSPLSDESLASESDFSIHIEKNRNPDKLSIQEWYNKNLKNNIANEPKSVENITVNNTPALKIEVAEIGVNAHIYISSGADTVEVIYPISQPKFQDTYNQILSTFRFIDSVDTSNGTHINIRLAET